MKNSIFYYNMDGEPIGREEAEELLWSAPKRRVALTKVGPYEVSTVLLCIDHNFSSDTRPVIFETMVFCDDEKDPNYQDMERYCTKEAALKGHNEIVARLSASDII